MSNTFEHYKNIFTFFKGYLAAAPANPQNGWIYVNTVDNKVYIYNGATLSWIAIAEANTDFLKIEQVPGSPQTILYDAPIFDSGLKSNDDITINEDKWINLDGL